MKNTLFGVGCLLYALTLADVRLWRSAGKMSSRMSPPPRFSMSCSFTKQAKWQNDIITMRDIEAMLGFNGQTKQAFDCSEMSCLAEIGGSLGVDELLYPRVTGIGDELMLSFTLLDVAKAEVFERSSVTIENDANNYREASNRALNELWSAVGIEPTEKTEPTMAPSQSDVKLESSPSPSRVHPPILDFDGKQRVLTRRGTYFGLDARSKYDLAQSGDVGSQAAIDDGKQSALLTNISAKRAAGSFGWRFALAFLVVVILTALLPDSALSFVPFASPEGKTSVVFSKEFFDDAVRWDSGFCLIGL